MEGGGEVGGGEVEEEGRCEGEMEEGVRWVKG